MKTHSVKKNEIKRDWYLIDATDVRLGKLASEVAKLLLGKSKPLYAPNLVTGDSVIVINAPKISLSANKADKKVYYRHSGYIGNLKQETLGSLLERRPQEVVRKAIKGMLPHNKLGRQILKNLYVYTTDEHKHKAQNPTKIEINKK